MGDGLGDRLGEGKANCGVRKIAKIRLFGARRQAIKDFVRKKRENHEKSRGVEGGVFSVKLKSAGKP